jgi:predicted TIM-barrel fold metal-dependent hydrolase
MRTITLEEHYATPAFVEGPGRHLRGDAELAAALCDVGDGRIAAMDAAGIDVQVLSLTAPGVEQLPPDDAVVHARAANDAVAEAVRRHPDRLAAFAAVPTPAPERAAEELERAVRTLGLKGAVISGHVAGRYLDDRFFEPVLERAQALDVPIYLHPTPPPAPVRDTYYGGFAPDVSHAFATGAWGWHIETAVHVVRLVLGGVFDRLPRLQVVIGHMGEALPFMLPRLDVALPVAVTKLARPVGAYLRENVHYTFAGFNWTSTFLPLVQQVGVDRIMFSADHPYRSMADARAFLDAVPVSPADRDRIAHANAERLLRL